MVCIPNTKETIHPSISFNFQFNSAYDTGAESYVRSRIPKILFISNLKGKITSFHLSLRKD